MFDNCLVWLFTLYYITCQLHFPWTTLSEIVEPKTKSNIIHFCLPFFIKCIIYLVLWMASATRSVQWSVICWQRFSWKTLVKNGILYLYRRKLIFACTGKSHHFSKDFTQAFFVMKILWRTRARLCFIFFRTIFLSFLHIWLLFGSPI